MLQLSKYLNIPSTSNSTRAYNDDLQDYMFSKENIERYIDNIRRNAVKREAVKQEAIKREVKKEVKRVAENKKTENKKTEEKVQRPRSKIYKPRQKDTLFWCFYIIKNGFANYEMEIHNQYFTVEMNSKYDYVEHFRQQTNKDILKLHKIKPLSEIETDLSSNKQISLKTFFALCAVNKLNVIVVDKRKIYELKCTDSAEVFVVHKNAQGNDYWLETDVEQTSLNKYRNEYYNVIGFDQGLKAMSSYKLNDLVELCKKFSVKLIDGKKYTKTEIYEMLIAAY